MILRKSNENYDFIFEIMSDLFRARLRQGLTLDMVNRATGIEIEEIDNIEIGRGDIDFRKVLELCVFYNIKLSIDPQSIAFLNPDLIKQYAPIFYN